jgi:hypothetical protein
MSHWTQLAIGTTLFAFGYLSLLVWKRHSPARSFRSFLPVLLIVFGITGYLLSLEKFPVWLDLPLPVFVFALPALFLIPLTSAMKRLGNVGDRIFSFALRRKRLPNLLIAGMVAMGLANVLRLSLPGASSSSPEEVAGLERYVSFYLLVVFPFLVALPLSLRKEFHTAAGAAVYENGMWIPMGNEGGWPGRFNLLPWEDIQHWSWDESGDLVLTRESWTGRSEPSMVPVHEDARDRIDEHLRAVLGAAATR